MSERRGCSTGRHHPCCFHWSGALHSCKIKFVSEESKPDLVWLCKSLFQLCGKRSQNPIEALGAKWSLLFSPCLLPSPSKFYFYKICRWPHLILHLVLESQHFLEALQLLTSQSSAEHSCAQNWRISFGFCFGVLNQLSPSGCLWGFVSAEFCYFKGAEFIYFAFCCCDCFTPIPRISEEANGPVGFHVVLEITRYTKFTKTRFKEYFLLIFLTCWFMWLHQSTERSTHSLHWILNLQSPWSKCWVAGTVSRVMSLIF